MRIWNQTKAHLCAAVIGVFITGALAASCSNSAPQEAGAKASSTQAISLIDPAAPLASAELESVAQTANSESGYLFSKDEVTVLAQSGVLQDGDTQLPKTLAK